MCVKEYVYIWADSDSPTHGKRVVGGDCLEARLTKQAKQHGPSCNTLPVLYVLCVFLASRSLSSYVQVFWGMYVGLFRQV